MKVSFNWPSDEEHLALESRKRTKEKKRVYVQQQVIAPDWTAWRTLVSARFLEFLVDDDWRSSPNRSSSNTIRT